MSTKSTGSNASITIVGLGPGNPGQLTHEARQVLEAAEEVYLRTRRHPTLSAFEEGQKWHAFDELYEQAASFTQVYATIADRILSLGQRPDGVVYAVPGHPLVGEAAVDRILYGAEEAGLPVRIVAGLSFIEPVLTALKIDALTGLQVVDATDLAAMHHPALNPDLPALVAQLYGRQVAADVKLTLMNQYPPEHGVVLAHGAGTTEQQIVSLPLFELDRQTDLAHLTTLYLPPLPQIGGFESFQETVAHLRAPEGCPWDREQTHQSLRSSLLEETYEVLAALDRDDPEALCEELGDLLLQIVLHAQIATETETFTMADVIGAVDAKIKRRHPHVWGEQTAAGTGEVLRNWEVLKAQERQTEGGGRRSLLDGVPATLPALAQAEAYGRRAARVGFDWPDVVGVVEKVHEEIAELEVEAAGDQAARMAELGDLLFAISNWARWLDIDPEAALRETNTRFANRFAWMEGQAERLGRTLLEMNMEELETLWQAAKRAIG
jgi:tetrapyrrole methylase family protein/MazG family protein